MRLAIIISFALLGCGFSGFGAPLHKCAVGTHVGYVLSDAQAMACKGELLDSLPGDYKVQGFWTPTDQDVAVADRVFHDMIKRAITYPAMLFPNLPETSDNDSPDTLAHQRKELSLIIDHYDEYQRQYVGLVIDGSKLVFCNYSTGTKFDPADGFIFMQRAFVPEKSHFLQCQFEPVYKNASNVAIIGSWQ